MKIYNYDRETKEFISQTEASKNPREEDKFLIPANATTIEPIETKEGFAVCFNEELKEWEYVEDNRGKTVYSIVDKTESQISYLGEIKEGCTLEEPKEFESWNGTEWEIDIEALKESKKNNINNSCDTAIISGFYSEALGSKHFYYSTIAEQSTLNSLINLGVDNMFKAQKVLEEEEGKIKLEQRKQHPHTIDQLRAVLADGAIHINTQVTKKDNLEALINKATTVEEIEAITWEEV